MWFLMQLLGFSDVVTAAIGVCTSVGAAIGFLIGGGAGDYFSIRFPNAARPAINQISLVFAAPLYIAFLKGLPGRTPSHLEDSDPQCPVLSCPVCDHVIDASHPRGKTGAAKPIEETQHRGRIILPCAGLGVRQSARMCRRV